MTELIVKDLTEKELKKELPSQWDLEKEFFEKEIEKEKSNVDNAKLKFETVVHTINASRISCGEYIIELYQYISKWYPKLPRISLVKDFNYEFPPVYNFNDAIEKAKCKPYADAANDYKKNKNGRLQMYAALKDIREKRKICINKLKHNSNYYSDLYEIADLYRGIISAIKVGIKDVIEPEMDWVNALAIAITTQNAINHNGDVEHLSRPKMNIFMQDYENEYRFMRELQLYYEKIVGFYTEDTLTRLINREAFTPEVKRDFDSFKHSIERDINNLKALYVANTGEINE